MSLGKEPTAFQHLLSCDVRIRAWEGGECILESESYSQVLSEEVGRVCRRNAHVKNPHWEDSVVGVRRSDWKSQHNYCGV